MRRHVVVALAGVDVVGFALPHEPVEDGRQIGTHIGIGVFIDREGCRGVFDKEMQDARSGQRREIRFDLAGDQMEAPAAGAKREFGLRCHTAVRFKTAFRWCKDKHYLPDASAAGCVPYRCGGVIRRSDAISVRTVRGPVFVRPDGAMTEFRSGRDSPIRSGRRPKGRRLRV